ncbi:hypothetical protein F4558_003004 [Micromonospora profundi]|nr:hypothetical protein [Micromonospora profundi]
MGLRGLIEFGQVLADAYGSAGSAPERERVFPVRVRMEVRVDGCAQRDALSPDEARRARPRRTAVGASGITAGAG